MIISEDVGQSDNPRSISDRKLRSVFYHALKSLTVVEYTVITCGITVARFATFTVREPVGLVGTLVASTPYHIVLTYTFAWEGRGFKSL